MHLQQKVVLMRAILRESTVVVLGVLLTAWFGSANSELRADDVTIEVGAAETDITPPLGFPMAGYFHERLNEGTKDSLKARAIVFRGSGQQAALVVCDLIGIWTDFSRLVKEQASQRTGIPADCIVVSATHSHTAPDYCKALYGWIAARNPPVSPAAMTGVEQNPERLAWIERLIENTVQAIVKAQANATPVMLESGWVEQQVPVAFNRRFVQKDGSVRTWVGLEYADTVRSAGPIDPEIPLLLAKSLKGEPKTVLSNYALHLDTVGGMQWSADYPGLISQALQQALGPQVVSVFGTGCCGDINHVNPRGKDRNTTQFIGESIGKTIVDGLPTLRVIDQPVLKVRSAVVRVPLQQAAPEAVAESVRVLKAVQAGEPVDFYAHVTAHKTVMIDQIRNVPRLVRDEDGALARRTTHGLIGAGDSLPVEINVIALGQDLAIVCLPGEVFVELGLAIKRASPFRQTMVIELSNAVETYYVPTRAAFAGGGYEPTNSTIASGGGELLVEEAIRLLQSAAKSVE